MIAGIGTDITEFARIRAAVEKYRRQFLNRLLTGREQEESRGLAAYYAGRWAAKEAIAKALGCGIGARCAFTDIEILRNQTGQPEATLAGAAARTAQQLHIVKIHLSISHERRYAVATALLESKSGDA